MISINQIKNGMVLLIDGQLYLVTDFQHVKPGKGSAFVKTKLKNLKLGTTFERTFKTSDKLEDVFIEEKNLQFLYKSGTHYHFMDHETFEEIVADEEILGHVVKFLRDNMEVSGSVYEGKIICVELPIFIELKIQHTEPGLKGDTAKSGTKPATLETGAVIQVPLFLETGDSIKLDTRTETYVNRV